MILEFILALGVSASATVKPTEKSMTDRSDAVLCGTVETVKKTPAKEWNLEVHISKNLKGRLTGTVNVQYPILEERPGGMKEGLLDEKSLRGLVGKERRFYLKSRGQGDWGLSDEWFGMDDCPK